MLLAEPDLDRPVMPPPKATKKEQGKRRPARRNYVGQWTT